MSKIAKRFVALSSEGKSLVILALLSIIPFLAMLPLFFFHGADGYPLGAYALGWLLGSLVGLAAYWSIAFGAKSLLRGGEDGSLSLSLTVLFNFLRIALYAAVLVISGICTFKSEWFGGFDAFNFWTAFGGLIPMTIVSLLTHFFELKAVKEEPSSSTKDKAP